MINQMEEGRLSRNSGTRKREDLKQLLPSGQREQEVNNESGH